MFRSVVKYGVTYNPPYRWYIILHPPNATKRTKFNPKIDGMICVKRITSADVLALNSRFVRSTLVAAYVGEWCFEMMRLEFTPYTEKCIAGTGSIEDEDWREEAKQQPVFRAEIATALLVALDSAQYVKANADRRTR